MPGSFCLDIFFLDMDSPGQILARRVSFFWDVLFHGGRRFSGACFVTEDAIYPEIDFGT